MDLFPDIFAARRTVSTGVATSTTTATPATYTYGTVGTYVIALLNFSGNGGQQLADTTVAGSALRRYFIASPGTYTSGINSSTTTAVTNSDTIALGLTGTWRALTHVGGPNSATNTAYLGLFVRIA